MHGYMRNLLFGLVITASLIGSVCVAEPSLVINEFMASNSGYVQDPQGQYNDWIEIHNFGSNPINVVHAIANRRKAVLIDCAFMDQPAGTICRFTPDEIISKKAEAPLSLHQADLLKALEISQKLGECPEEVVIYGIQPERVTPGDSLSPLLYGLLDDYAEKISAELLASA